MALSALPSWSSSPTREAIVYFVEATNQGQRLCRLPTGWPCSTTTARCGPKADAGPGPFHRRVSARASCIRHRACRDRALPQRSRGGYDWLAQAREKRAAGDDADLRIVIGAITHSFDRLSVTDYAAAVAEFTRTAQYLTLRRPYLLTTYKPVVELLRFLEDNGFSCHIVSGGDRDFMRPIVQRCYGIPPERVIGSALGVRYESTIGDVRYGSSFEFMDNGPEKPARIWCRIGRCPLFTAGNSDGDAQMLDTYSRGTGQDSPSSSTTTIASATPRLTTSVRIRSSARRLAAVTPWRAFNTTGQQSSAHRTNPANACTIT